MVVLSFPQHVERKKKNSLCFPRPLVALGAKIVSMCCVILPYEIRELNFSRLGSNIRVLHPIFVRE